mgnify:CR=1 FL=1
MRIKKAVIAVAGYGTRFLPQTKASPKEMLPIIDKPVIHYVVEEAISCGVTDVVIVTSWQKRTVEDYFDFTPELEQYLRENGKENLIELIDEPAKLANFIYIRQKGPYGNAIPVKNAKSVLGDDPFIVLYGDEFMEAKPLTRPQQLAETFEKYNAPVISCIETTEPNDGGRYAFVEGELVEDNIIRVRRIVEKPGIGKAQSNHASVAGYLLTKDIFPILDNQKPGVGGEYYLPEAINELAQITPVYARKLNFDRWHDAGNKLEYSKTVVELALRDPDIGKALKEHILKII